MIVKPDISAEEFVRRIPFMKKFKNVSNEHWTHLTKLDENYDVKMTIKDEIIHFKQVNTNIEFIYYKDKINDNYFYHFIIKYQLLLTQPEGMSDFSWTVLIHVNNSQNEALSFSKQIMSKNETLSDEELSKMINELNGHFFKIDDYINNLNTNIQNPLNESNIKTLIKEHLHRLVKSGYKIVPQD